MVSIGDAFRKNFVSTENRLLTSDATPGIQDGVDRTINAASLAAAASSLQQDSAVSLGTKMDDRIQKLEKQVAFLQTQLSECRNKIVAIEHRQPRITKITTSKITEDRELKAITESILQDSGIVLVVFGATWCHHCTQQVKDIETSLLFDAIYVFYVSGPDKQFDNRAPSHFGVTIEGFPLLLLYANIGGATASSVAKGYRTEAQLEIAKDEVLKKLKS